MTELNAAFLRANDVSEAEIAKIVNRSEVNEPAPPEPSPTDHQYVINTRSFAPPESFGGGFQGDNRGYSTDDDVTSRIHSQIWLDTDDQTEITNDDVSAHSDPSVLHFIPTYAPTETPDVEIIHQSIENDGDVTITNVLTKHSGKDAVPEFTVPEFIPGIGGNSYNPSPSLDVYTDLRLVDDRNRNVLNVNGRITGDNFPATEVYITDNSGQSLFLATGQPPAVATPIVNLPNYGMAPRHIANVDVTVNTDDSGNFVSVESAGETLTIEQWNEQFTSNEPTFIDPLEPVNAAALEAREGYGEINREINEAGQQISEADGFVDTSGEILEAGAEIGWESAELVGETTVTATVVTGETIVDIGQEGWKTLNSWLD